MQLSPDFWYSSNKERVCNCSCKACYGMAQLIGVGNCPVHSGQRNTCALSTKESKGIFPNNLIGKGLWRLMTGQVRHVNISVPKNNVECFVLIKMKPLQVILLLYSNSIVLNTIGFYETSKPYNSKFAQSGS